MDKRWTQHRPRIYSLTSPVSSAPKYILNLPIPLHLRGHPPLLGHHYLLSGQLREPQILPVPPHFILYTALHVKGSSYKEARHPLLRALHCLPGALRIKSEI